METTSTPNEMVWFTTSENGRRMAWRWGGRHFQARAFRVGVAEAEMMVATERAVRVHCHPMRFCEQCDR